MVMVIPEHEVHFVAQGGDENRLIGWFVSQLETLQGGGDWLASRHIELLFSLTQFEM
jgi:hypothetical protein